MSSKKTKSSQAETEKNQQVKKTAGDFTVGGALQALAQVQAKVGQTFAGVGEQLQSKLQELETVKKALTLEKEEAERIHGVEAIARSIEEANAAFDDNRAELQKREEILHNEFNERQEKLNKQGHQAAIDMTTQRTRDQEQWTFAFEVSKRDAKAKFDEELRQLQLNERVRKEAIEKNWADREEGIRKQETEIAELRTKVAAFPAELDAEVKKHTAIVGSSMKRDKDHEIQILSGQFGAAKTVSDNTIANLQLQLQTKDKVIEQLQVQLAAANKSNTDIANKALETAGNVKALADLQQATQIAASNGQKRA